MKLVLGIIWTLLCGAWIWIIQKSFKDNDPGIAKALAITILILAAINSVIYYTQFFTA